MLVLGARRRCWVEWRHAGGWCWRWVLVPVLVPGAGCPVQVLVLVVAGAGAGCRVPVLAVLVLAGAGAVSWLCTWWRQVAGAAAGAGAVSWLCAWWREVGGAGAGACWCCELAVHVVETGCWCRCWCCQGLYCFARILLYVHCSMRNVRLSTDHCFSMFQPATHEIVALDTAWPWASEAHGLCCLRALFCARKLIRARSYGLIVLQIVASSMLQRQ